MGCVSLFHVLQLADHKRQARPFILSLDAQIPSSPKECLPKGNVNYLNKKTGVYPRIRSFLISDYVKYPRA